MLGRHQGATVNRQCGEQLSFASLAVTEEGKQDPLLADLPRSFQAIVGHKEACELLPPGAVCLITSTNCPVQMFRVKSNLYATQFHPELNMEGLKVRVEIYKTAGYFAPEDGESIIAAAKTTDLSYAPIVLQNFIRRYRRSL